MTWPSVKYVFSFADGRREEFVLRFDAETFDLEAPRADSLPAWTRLTAHQCSNCPLTEKTHTHCPLAVALAEPVHRFGDVVSYEAMQVEVITEERRMLQDTTAQDGISALLGLINATSGCPITAFFKPMARYHLPFANEHETIYRAAGMYLMGEYFRAREGKCDPDMALKGLLAIYRDMEIVNRGIVARLRAAKTQDSALNAIVLLDLYAKSLPYAVEASLRELKYLFHAYLR
jgi:hypothetical protein